MDKITKISRYYILPIYWAFLTYMLLKPGDEFQEHWFMFPGFDKLIHFSIFGFLAFVFLVSFPKVSFLNFFQIMLCYGFLSEILQDVMHLGRALEVGDVIADSIGVVIGWLIFRIFNRFIVAKFQQ